MSKLSIKIEFPKTSLYEINDLYKKLGIREVNVNNAKDVKDELIDIIRKYKITLKTYGVKRER